MCVCRMRSLPSPAVAAYVLGWLSLGGCAPAVVTSVPEVHIDKAKMTAMPADVELNELSLSLGPEPTLTTKPDWTKSAALSIDAAIKRRLALHGGVPFTPDAVPNTDPSLRALSDWAQGTLLEIGEHLKKHGDSTRHLVSGWKFGGDLNSQRTRLRAEFLLLVLFRDTQETGGLIATNQFSMIRHKGRKFGVGCVMNLRDGRMVWCQRTEGPFVDLRTAAGASEAVNQLVGELLPPPAPKPL